MTLPIRDLSVRGKYHSRPSVERASMSVSLRAYACAMIHDQSRGGEPAAGSSSFWRTLTPKLSSAAATAPNIARRRTRSPSASPSPRFPIAAGSRPAGRTIRSTIAGEAALGPDHRQIRRTLIPIRTTLPAGESSARRPRNAKQRRRRGSRCNLTPAITISGRGIATAARSGARGTSSEPACIYRVSPGIVRSP